MSLPAALWTGTRSLPRRVARISMAGRLSRQTTTTRTLSSVRPEPLVKLEMQDETKIGILTMNRPPANTLSLEMFNALSEAIRTAEDNPKMEALIVSSSSPKIFCAGLDLNELFRPDRDRLYTFWNAFQQLYLDLYGSRLSTVAAIGGHAPAAGCMIALSCDFRVMSASNEGKIGLNESLLGIVAPPWLGQQYMDTIGVRRAESALSLGSLFFPQEAFELGLVDEVVHDEIDVVDVAMEHAGDWVKIPAQARVGAKKLTRGRQIQHLVDNREADTEAFCSFITQDKVQKTLELYKEKMASRKKK